MIDAGTGDDIIVLSTDDSESSLSPDFSPNNARSSLQNDASNETIVLTGDNFGDDVVMNFETEGSRSLEDYESSAPSSEGFDPENDGLDFLDFTAYLTSERDVSPNEGAADTSDSYNPIPVTWDVDAVDVEANEVSVVRFDEDGDAGETFAALSASDIADLFNNTIDDTDDAYGTLAEAGFSVTDGYSDDALVNDGKAIIMVENGDNLGEYKVFEITWDGNADDPIVTAVERGSLDFGTSLDGLQEVNLVGSADYATLMQYGFNGEETL